MAWLIGYVTVVALVSGVGVGIAWHLMATDRGQRASGQRPETAHQDGRHTLTSRPPAAITDDAPEHDDFWRVASPQGAGWDAGLRYAVPALRNGRA